MTRIDLLTDLRRQHEEICQPLIPAPPEEQDEEEEEQVELVDRNEARAVLKELARELSGMRGATGFIEHVLSDELEESEVLEMLQNFDKFHEAVKKSVQT